MSHLRSSLPLLAPAVAVTILLLLAACKGGGNDSSNADSTPSAQETPASTEESAPTVTGEPTEEVSATRTGEIDPCSLLTREEVEAAVGNPVEEGVLGLGGCDWDSDPEDTNAHLALIPVSDVSACIQTRRERAKDVSGLGVEAWWEFSQAGVTGGVVTACLDGWLVQVTLVSDVTTGVGEATLRAASEDLMAKALGRM